MFVKIQVDNIVYTKIVYYKHKWYDFKILLIQKVIFFSAKKQ